MSKALKWELAVLAVVALYVGSTWAISRSVQPRVDELVAHMGKQLNGVIQIHSTKSTRSFFTTVQNITFSFVGPGAALIVPPGKDGKESRFILRNVIHHGPLPRFRTFGVARIESALVMNKAAQERQSGIFRGDKPLEISMTLGFSGATRIDIKSPSITSHGVDGTDMIWKGLQSSLEYSSDFKQLKATASFPGLSITGKDKSTLAIDDMQLSADFKTQFEYLYVGNGSMRIADISMTPVSTSQPIFRAKGIDYSFRSTIDDDYYDFALGFAAVAVETAPPVIEHPHLQLAMHHLHAPTTVQLAKLGQDFNASSRAPGAARQIPTAEFQALISTLLQRSPELVVERAGFATEHGDLKVTAHVSFGGVTAQDAQTLDERLINKLKVVADVSTSQGLPDNWPTSQSVQELRQRMKQFEEQGFVARNGDRLETHIEFANGALTANGKPYGTSTGGARVN